MDYTPQQYYLTNGEVYTATAEEFEGSKPSRLKIAIRKEYWDIAGNQTAYAKEEKVTPYDEIGNIGYQLMHLAALRTRVLADTDFVMEEKVSLEKAKFRNSKYLPSSLM